MINIEILEAHCKKLEENIKEQNEKILSIENQEKKFVLEKDVMIKNINYARGAYDAYSQMLNSLKEVSKKQEVTSEVLPKEFNMEIIEQNSNAECI